MDPTLLLVAIIGAIGVIASPLILAYLNSRQLRITKEMDYARQDLIAQRAEQAAKDIAASNAQAAAAAASAAATQRAQLNQIHTLVNDNLTQAQQRELDATKAMLVSMRKVIELQKQLGIAPEMEVITITEQRVAAMERDLDHRAKQTALATKRRVYDDERAGNA